MTADDRISELENQSSRSPRSIVTSRNPSPMAISAAPGQSSRMPRRRRSLALRRSSLGLGDEQLHQQQRQNADRDIDQEYPVPGEMVGDRAAEHRADGGRQDHGKPVHGERLPAPLRRKGVHQHRLRDGLQSAAGDALNDARENQKRQTGRKTAAERCGRE